MTDNVKVPAKPTKSKMAKETGQSQSEPKIDTPRNIIKPLQFKVDIEIYKEFKQLSLDEDLQGKDMFIKLLRFYQQSK